MIAGRYSLDREIGRGGTGVVWLGRDEVLGRQVALKRIGLLPGADSTDLARAEREAQLSARLNHPHVVAIYDVVVDSESGAHWLVMEYVDGATLGQLVKRKGAFSPDEAGPLLWQVADALVAAHAAGIVHRDVKPSNVLVDRTWRAKLTDFGIARIATDPSLTQTGMVTGSPAYLAPEIATGRGSDAAADVWSLGATAFHLLEGRQPYEIGDNVLGGLYRIVNDEPPQPSADTWLSPLLAGTMVREPSQRWSMEQVRNFLADRVPPTTTGTQELAAAAPATRRTAPAAAATATGTAGGTAVARGRRPPTRLLVLALALVAAVTLGLLVWALLPDPEPAAKKAAPPSPGASSTSASPSPSPSPSPSRQPSPSPSPSPSAEPRPTEAGMKAFIRDYVATVAADPDAAWPMLTPKFQRESGGLRSYREFWNAATNGRVLSISANPENLSVSYQVRFDNFDNGPGPTVLDLVFDGERYRIDGERSEGFTPAG